MFRFVIVLLSLGVTLSWGNEPPSVNNAKTSNDNGLIRGQVGISIAGIDLGSVGPIVVYLDAADYKSTEEIRTVSQEVSMHQVHQEHANFFPDFVVVTVGQVVEFPNNDTIMHNVFSYSRPNHFDLGLYPKGTSKSVTFHYPGIVRIYCSIHKSMNGKIFVAPTSFHSVANYSGVFEISGIPSGKYHLKTWNAMLPETSSEIAITAGKIENTVITIQEQN